MHFSKLIWTDENGSERVRLLVIDTVNFFSKFFVRSTYQWRTSIMLVRFLFVFGMHNFVDNLRSPVLFTFVLYALLMLCNILNSCLSYAACE